MRHLAVRAFRYGLPALLLVLAAALTRPVAAQPTADSVRAASDKAHKDLAREAGEGEEEMEPAPEPAPFLRPRPVVAPEPLVPEVPAEIPAQPRPAVEPAPVVAPPAVEPAPAPKPAAPKARLGIPVTLYWHMADDADVYLNGRPLREYSPSFKTRGDEAPQPAFSTAAVLQDGDVFTVGGRRGGSFGFMLIATDASGSVLFATDQQAWKVYTPGDRADWFEPAAAKASRSGPVTVQPSPWFPQVQLNGQHENKALSIWASPSETFAYLFGTVSLPGSAERVERAVSLRSYNYPGRLIRVRDSLAELSDVDKEDADFKKVPGLADASAVSFESMGSPGRFLRHQSGRLKLDSDSGDRLFKEDATFKVVPGLADSSAVSFESFNYPGYYIRHRDYHLYVEKGSDDLFRKDATFSFVDAQAR
ncbi:MAG: AbfB domain-containing protein [Elusimicrobia bacterium]|nr:AbfB domain-containing protein [Elusimicrobiota bacterium]